MTIGEILGYIPKKIAKGSKNIMRLGSKAMKNSSTYIYALIFAGYGVEGYGIYQAMQISKNRENPPRITIERESLDDFIVTYEDSVSNDPKNERLVNILDYFQAQKRMTYVNETRAQKSELSKYRFEQEMIDDNLLVSGAGIALVALGAWMLDGEKRKKNKAAYEKWRQDKKAWEAHKKYVRHMNSIGVYFDRHGRQIRPSNSPSNR